MSSGDHPPDIGMAIIGMAVGPPMGLLAESRPAASVAGVDGEDGTVQSRSSRAGQSQRAPVNKATVFSQALLASPAARLRSTLDPA
jgi:hypothetical protein